MKNFLLGLSSSLKEAVQDRAKLEMRSQSDLIREAIDLYLLKPIPWARKKDLDEELTIRSEEP